MTKSKKYDLRVEKKDSEWLAQITRRVSSRKTTVTKEQDGFATQAEAQTWGEAKLAEFTKTQGVRNMRHAEQRKSNEEVRRQRSGRRADKTAQAKSEESRLDGTDEEAE